MDGTKDGTRGPKEKGKVEKEAKVSTLWSQSLTSGMRDGSMETIQKIPWQYIWREFDPSPSMSLREQPPRLLSAKRTMSHAAVLNLWLIQ